MTCSTFKGNDSIRLSISRLISKMVKAIERGGSSKVTVIFLSIALLISGANFLPASSPQAYSMPNNASTSFAADEIASLNLQGEEAIEHLKKQGLYSSLEEAMSTARYKGTGIK